MPRPKPTKYTAQQELFVRMEARGEGRPEIMRQVFGLDVNTSPQNELHNADCQMSRWRQYPCYEATWKAEVNRVLRSVTGEAIKVIKGQLKDDKLPWLQNKAANDLLNYGRSQLMGEDEKTVNIRFDGMPELGSPEQEDG